MQGDRLITQKSRKRTRGPSFAPYAKRVGYVKPVNYAGNGMYVGYEDFPAPDAVR